MGHVYVEARLFARRSVTARFLVDTGATYSIIPPALPRKVGAALSAVKFRVTLADGSKRSLKACTVGIELLRRSAPMTALILPGGEPLLGVETLEALGLRVNPSRHTLEPSRAQAALLVSVRLPTRVATPRSHGSRGRRRMR
ncbi:MAG: aspartyl protease family protein [Candidatus Binatia bacterium]